MKKSFPIPTARCDACGGSLIATLATKAPVLTVVCEECALPWDFGEASVDLARDAKRRAKSAAGAISRSLVELKKTVPKSRDELFSVVRNPRHPFTATLLTGIALLLMEMSGFGVFVVLTWILGNLVLNPIGWVLIPVVVAIGFSYRRVFARDSFERIRTEVQELQQRYDRGEITELEFQHARDQVLAGAFDDVAIEDVLKDGDYDADVIERVRSASANQSPEWIWNEEHLDALRQAIKDTESQLFIYSGWLGINVIDFILEDLELAMKRGAIVHIGYGWQSPSKPEPETEYEKQALTKLAGLNADSSPGSIKIKRFPNHSKLLVCDTKYVICGSANWLNNRKYHNREISVRLYESDLVTQFLAESTADFAAE